MSTIPTRPEHVTAEWLTGFLAPRNPGVEVEDIEILSSTQGAATRLRVKPRYREGADTGLPPVLFIKTSLTRRMLLADPQMYVNEVRFYERIRPDLDCETPAVFAWALDEETKRFAVVMEDLSLRDAAFPNATTALTASQVAPLMSTLAAFHAPYWGRTDLTTTFDWMETSTRGGTVDFWRHDARAVIEHELEQDYKLEAFDPTRHSLDQLFAGLARLWEANDEPPLTVLHGDTHIGNCYLLPDGGGGLLDWQLMRVANWGNDVAYTVMTALDVDERRRGEQDLLRFYLDELRRHGVDPPGWEAAWTLYRQQMVWGIAAWLCTPTSMYSVELLDRLVRRCVTAADDLDTYGLLGV